MSVEVDEHGHELSATCRACDNAITDNEAADHDGKCYVCFEEDELEAEQHAVNVPVCCSMEMAYNGQRGFYCLRCGRGPT